MFSIRSTFVVLFLWYTFGLYQLCTNSRKLHFLFFFVDTILNLCFKLFIVNYFDRIKKMKTTPYYILFVKDDELGWADELGSYSRKEIMDNKECIII